MTALTMFNNWIRDEVAPLLKEHGFARTGSTFRARVGSNIALIQIQKSVKSSAIEVHFTATAGVWSCRVAAFLDRSSIDRVPSIEQCHWTQRLGEMILPGEDYWWELHSRQNDREGLQQFIDVLVQRAIPAVQTMASDEVLRDLWLAGNGPGLTSIQRLVHLSILLREIGPQPALPTVIDQLDKHSRGKPVRASVQAHLRQLAVLSGNEDAAN